MKMRVAAAVLSTLALGALLGIRPAMAVPTLAAEFADDYVVTQLGAPIGLPTPFGGVTFLNNSTLLIGGAANGGAGAIYSFGVNRDSGGHITSLGAGSFYAAAPFIDGGLQFGPGGVLFYTAFPTNDIGQIKPGSISPDRVDSINSDYNSVGALGFVPTGFAGAGQMKVVSYNGGGWGDATLTPDGLGTYDVTVHGVSVVLSGGPEGFSYVKGTNPGFDVDSLLLTQYGAGTVSTYAVDANGDPIPGTVRLFLTGLTGAEGSTIDPLTGDFVFSTFGSVNEVVVVSGFEPPPSADVPAPASLMLMGLGLAFLGYRARHRAA